MRTKVTAIAEHTYMLTDRLTGVNQFLLEGKEKALLIDTGYGTKSLPRVVEKLTSLPVMVVNTHLHPDHSNGNGFFGKVMVGEPDLPSHGVPSNYIFEGVASAYRKSLLRPLMSVARKFALIDPSAAEYSPLPDMIHLGERSLDAVPCPGHTAGSVIFCDSETDFIFAIIGEELGMMGALVVVALFIALLYSGMRIANAASTAFGTMVAGSCTIMLVFQAFLNIGCVVGLLPTTGKPLPFISSGGSSLIATFIMVGLILSVSKEAGGPSIYEQRRANLRVVRAADPDEPSRAAKLGLLGRR